MSLMLHVATQVQGLERPTNWNSIFFPGQNLVLFHTTNVLENFRGNTEDLHCYCVLNQGIQTPHSAFER